MPASSSSKRRCGAPQGNQNARKHGFHSSQYPATTAISRLVRTHRYLNPALDPRDELTHDIRQALKEVYARIESGEMSQP